jgi:molybdopterin-containing oxidoreductase family iron-sulfur binding subunit
MKDGAGQRGPTYWRSLDELADTPAFRQWLQSEFPHLPAGFVDGPSRRQFLKLMGASLAFAGLAGCRWPKETIVPAARQPGDRVPGVPVQYATVFELGGAATGLLVTSYDGRPIKIEGNEKHPFSRGKTNHWMQASILDLYDPDRSRQPVERTWSLVGHREYPPQKHHRAWVEFVAFARRHFDELRTTGGRGLAVLTEQSSSPSLRDMHGRFLTAFPQAAWYEYEPLSRDNEREGARRAFGRPFRTHLHLDQADVVVSFDDDFLMMHPAAVKYAGDFAARRRADDGLMNRLYVFEAGLTVTGSMADHRFAVRPSQIGRVLEELAVVLGDRLGSPILNGQPAGECPVARARIEALAADLQAHTGNCLLTVGPQQPPEVHALAHAINAALRAQGARITFTDDPDPQRPTHFDAIRTLAERVRSGEIQTLVILGGNPAYDAPADLGFAHLLPTIACSIHLSLYDNETSQVCTWHLPRAHCLEAWGDGLAWDGTLSIAQPLIEPLYGGRSPIELLALLCGDPLTTGYDIVRRTFGNSFDFGVNRQELWERALHDGVVPDTAWPARAPSAVRAPSASEGFASLPVASAGPVASAPGSSGSASGSSAGPPSPASGSSAGHPAPAPGAGFEIVFAPDYSVYDGRFANNGWLQEWPDPITKLTWGNAALISPADAAKLGIRRNGDHIAIDAGDATAPKTVLPVFILPGHAVGCITLPVGYGHDPIAGAVGGNVGVNAHGVRRGSATAWHMARVACHAGSSDLATTQDHHAIRSAVGDEETQRRVGVLVREATLDHYRAHPDFAQHVVHLPQLKSLWQEKEYTGHRWGMAIDLSACIGCGACVIACQAENNIPVVGKDEVLMGREMHWIRVDRYFRERHQGAEGSRGQGEEKAHASALSPSDPRPLGPSVEVVHQPVTCVHCENAPCEQVCPVAATVHDEEGLNVMVYNRCIGTRYCSNNCPFKVRRFNWFYNHHGPRHPRSQAAGLSKAPGLLKQAELSEIEKLRHNPGVTVRSRGVMEKCTFCVQRINAVKIKARNERWAKIPDGLIVPACAQACPTDAIVFGDLNDPDSRVRKLHEHNRAYHLLAELNIKPRTAYLAKLRNPAEGEPHA